MSFVRRAISVSFTLLNGNFNGSEGNTVTVSGRRVLLRINKSGVGLADAELRIYGMSLSLMNQLSTLGKYPTQENGNKIVIRAGDLSGGAPDALPVVFTGDISEAWADLNNPPESCFVVSAFNNGKNGLRPVPPTSYVGSVDAAVVMAGLAEEMQLEFENNGVSVMLENPYYPGTARQQAEACARAGHFECVFDDNTMAICPFGGKRGGLVPLISPETGLVGYPGYTTGAVSFTTEYNPSIRILGSVKIQSAIAPACGEWVVFSICHELESETPNGAWFTRVECQING